VKRRRAKTPTYSQMLRTTARQASPFTAKSEAAAPKLKAQAGWHIRPQPPLKATARQASLFFLQRARRITFFNQGSIVAQRICVAPFDGVPKNAPIQTAR